MKNFKHLNLILLAISLILSGSLVFAADFDKGLKAYYSGDHKTALEEWTPLALAEQGHVNAQLRLGLMYADGEGVLENDKTAVKWFTLAAEQGDSTAQALLGYMYYKGEGVLTDYKRAYMWHNISDYISNYLDAGFKDILAKSMSSAQIGKAQDMSSRCLASNYTDC